MKADQKWGLNYPASMTDKWNKLMEINKFKEIHLCGGIGEENEEFIHRLEYMLV